MQNIVLKDLIGKACYIYIDDIIIFGASADEYILNTRAVLQRLQDFNILLKLSKCKFGLTAVTYLGHLVERHGIRIEEKRKEEIKNMTLPDTVTKLRSFLGMTNYFSDFIHDYAAMSSVYYSLFFMVPSQSSKPFNGRKMLNAHLVISSRRL
jgi:hypothetical protein